MYLQADGFSQAKQRRSGTIFRDQHGRRYHAVVELKTGHPTGLIEPLFTAPLMPPQMYLSVGTNAERPYDLRIDYDRWIQDLRTAADDYITEARQLARKMYRDRYNAADPLTEEVVDIIGPRPQHVEPVIAAKQGNAYVLGLTDRVDVRLFGMLEEDRALRREHRASDEPDFSDVVESLDDAGEDAPQERTAQQKLEEQRTRDRERKRRQRDARKEKQQKKQENAATAA